MPKTKFQNVVFTLMMSFLMVYAMICYNISMNIGGMTNQVFLMAFHEMIIMWPAAFILEFFLVDHLAHKLAFCMVTPQDRPIVITLAISIMIIAIMCPIMSFIATLLFKNAGKEFVAVWLQTTFLNFPVAFFWQLMYCGPFIRFLFRKLFPENKKRYPQRRTAFPLSFHNFCGQTVQNGSPSVDIFCFLPGLLLRYRIGYADYMIIPGSFLPMIATLKSSSSFSTGISKPYTSSVVPSEYVTSSVVGSISSAPSACASSFVPTKTLTMFLDTRLTWMVIFRLLPSGHPFLLLLH